MSMGQHCPTTPPVCAYQGKMTCESMVGRQEGDHPTSMENEMSGFTFPNSFKMHEISTNSVTIHTRVGGAGPAVVLLHGYGETGDMWVPLAVDLARDHTAIVPRFHRISW